MRTVRYEMIMRGAGKYFRIACTAEVYMCGILISLSLSSKGEFRSCERGRGLVKLKTVLWDEECIILWGK